MLGRPASGCSWAPTTALGQPGSLPGPALRASTAVDWTSALTGGRGPASSFSLLWPWPRPCEDTPAHRAPSQAAGDEAAAPAIRVREQPSQVAGVRREVPPTPGRADRRARPGGGRQARRRPGARSPQPVCLPCASCQRRVPGWPGCGSRAPVSSALHTEPPRRGPCPPRCTTPPPAPPGAGRPGVRRLHPRCSRCACARPCRGRTRRVAAELSLLSGSFGA